MDATILSPAFTRHATEENIADMPVPVAKQASAPSSAARRSSNIATVGFEKRLYRWCSVSSLKADSAIAAES